MHRHLVKFDGRLHHLDNIGALHPTTPAVSSAKVYGQIKRATQPKNKLTTTPDAQLVTDSALNPAEDQI